MVDAALVDATFWAGRRVFVTGHTGFKGSWLSLWLERLGADVMGYALPPQTTPNLFDDAAVASGLRHRLGDIRDLAGLGDALSSHRPSVVFHLAAQSLVRAAYADPVGTYAANVMGTVHLLEAARRCPAVGAIVIVTSDKCYENREWVWGYRESDPLGGRDPYGTSKACAELVARAYRSSFFSAAPPGRPPVALASVRAGNVIGGGDWAPDRLVPDAMRAFLARVPLALRSPRAIRPWQHVLDPLSGYLLVAQRLIEEGPRHASEWNFGPERESERTVEQVIGRLARAWGPDASWTTAAAIDGAPHEATHLRLDCAKAKWQLGWSPRLDLDRALHLTVAWYKSAASGAEARALTLDQIARYEDAGQMPNGGMGVS